LLNRAQVASINFHPGPPEYPGIVCTNFAIYNSESTYGVTCHHMASTVDTGKIIAVKRFPLYPTDTVLSLTQRCYVYILTLFYEIASELYFGNSLPSCNETWKRKPYKRVELNELCKINRDMDTEEIKKRIKATTFPNAPGAYIEIDGMRFSYDQSKS
jgi:methionyl-tRNA formyltransferase